MRVQSVLFAALLAASCAKGGDGALRLDGAGATFPYPLYSKWVSEYGRVEAGLRVNYQSIGSGGGIRQIIAGTVDFGASDAPMTDADLKKAPAPLLHLPMTLGAVVVAYQAPGVPTGLRLTPELLADIFLGKVTRWNAPALAALNPGVALPDKPIVVVHRTDGSGTTAVFSELLAKTSAEWKTRVGSGPSLKWPTGLGAKGNEGVAGLLKTTPGAIGYVELAYATESKQPYALLRNRAGQFVAPTVQNVSAAADGFAASMPEDLRISITDAPGQSAYPLASFSFLLVYEAQRDGKKGSALVRFIRWALRDGQKLAPALHYAPLPAAVVAKVETRLARLTANGKPLGGQ